MIKLRKNNIKIFDEQHLTTLKLMILRAITLRKRDRKTEAEELMFQIVDIKKRIFESKHLHTLIAINNLISESFNQGNSSEIKIEIFVINTANISFEKKKMNTILHC